MKKAHQKRTPKVELSQVATTKKPDIVVQILSRGHAGTSDDPIPRPDLAVGLRFGNPDPRFPRTPSRVWRLLLLLREWKLLHDRKSDVADLDEAIRNEWDQAFKGLSEEPDGETMVPPKTVDEAKTLYFTLRKLFRDGTKRKILDIPEWPTDLMNDGTVTIQVNPFDDPHKLEIGTWTKSPMPEPQKPAPDAESAKPYAPPPSQTTEKGSKTPLASKWQDVEVGKRRRAAETLGQAATKEQPWANDASECPPPPESRCANMKKTDIAARILNRTNTKSVRPREVAEMMRKCHLRNEGNGKWTIRLDSSVLSAEAIERLRMPEWPPPPNVR